MLNRAARFGLLVGLFALALPTAGGADKPTKVEIAKRGKAATVFVEVPSRGTGTGFCIHPSGLFITNEHVVRGAERAEITLVLNPALEGQKVLKAKVVRVDKETDLALLRVDSVKDLPSLPLGSTENLTELADVVACGFPLGKALSPDKKEYPAISVNTGTVTSLRMKGGQLQHIQIDVALTFGNSGGPVLDENGKVVGVVVSGIGGGKAGINQAIPANQVERFLRTPEVTFDVPDLTPLTLEKPHDFRVRIIHFVPNAPEPSVKLILQAGDEKPREFPMKNVKGEWIATAIPVINTGAKPLELTARFGTASITGLVPDAELTIDGKPMKFSTLRKIEFHPKVIVTRTDGQTVEGAIAGLNAVEISLGSQKVKLDLMKATQVTVRVPDEITSVSATILVTTDGKEVARLPALIPVRGAFGAPSGPGSVAIKPPALTGDKITKQLPEVFSDAVVAGGGRYLIFQMPKLKKLGVFDISEAKITNYIPLAEERAVFAAGLDAVVVGLPSAKRLERWSLVTFEREKAVAYNGDISWMLMGHASTWSVVVGGVFLDPVTFKPLPMKYPDSPAYKGERAWHPGELPVYASADGTAYGRWAANQSPTICSARIIEGTEVKYVEAWNQTHIIPGPTGRWFYTTKGMITRDLKVAAPADEKFGYCLPATSGDYFLSLTSADDKGAGGSFTIHHRGMGGPTGHLEKIDHGVKFDGWDRDPYGPWRRVFFVPEAKVIAVLPTGNDRVVLYKFDLDEALNKSGLDYLFVTSQPPPSTKAGATYTYPLVVKSKHGGLTFALDSGPKGMTVSATGTITWTVPADATGDQDVILTVKDKTGQEAFHTFTVRVVK